MIPLSLSQFVLDMKVTFITSVILLNRGLNVIKLEK